MIKNISLYFKGIKLEPFTEGQMNALLQVEDYLFHCSNCNTKVNFTLIGEDTQGEIEKEVKSILDVLNQSYEMIDTLASANPWCDGVEDRINDVVNQIVEAKKKIEGV